MRFGSPLVVLSKPTQIIVCQKGRHYLAKFRFDGTGVTESTLERAVGRLVHEDAISPGGHLHLNAAVLVREGYECLVVEKVNFAAIGRACLQNPERYQLKIEVVISKQRTSPRKRR